MKSLHDDGAEPRPAPGAGLDRLFEVAVLIGGGMERDLGALGLTRARSEVIWILHHRGRMTQRELSDALHCSPRNVTGLVDALQAGGFATREPHPTDRRATLVGLTALGITTAEGWREQYDRLAAGLFADLSAAELSSFYAAFDRVLARLRDHARTDATSHD
jgi:DNA-binding MarR family transcriptional regulator